MRLRRLAAAAAGAVGATAVANRLLARRAGELRPALGGDVGRYRWRGFDVAYAEAGDPEDPDLLLVHGIHAAASNKEFDRIFDRLADSYHVVAPDLPGFGASDRPPLVYSASLYTAFLADFASDVTEDAVCLASSLSGAYAAEVQREAGLFSRLVLVSPTAETTVRRPWLRGLLRAPLVGTGLFNLLVSRPSLRWFSEGLSVSDPASMTAADLDYYWRTAHQRGARYAPASFVGGYLDPVLDLASALSEAAVPVTLVWGAEAGTPPVSAGRELAERADVRLLVVDDARLLPHHEHPDEVLAALDRELPALGEP